MYTHTKNLPTTCVRAPGDEDRKEEDGDGNIPVPYWNIEMCPLV